MKTILFVCTGNTCRSPMAEGLLRHALREDSQFQVRSGGVAAHAGAAPNPETVAVLKESGISLDQHCARPITREMIADAMLILAMTSTHKDIILELFPDCAERVFLLGEFTRDPALLEVPDPIGGGRQAYLETRDTIVAAIPALLDFLRHANDIEKTEAGEEH